MTTELALTPAASAAATGAVMRVATRTLIVTGPDIQTLLENVAVDIEVAPTVDVDSDDMAVELMDMLGRLSTVSSAIEAERLERGKPLNETLKWLMDGYRPPREMIEAIIAGGKAKLTAYNRAKQEAKRKADAELAEQRRLEAEEAARQEAVAIAAAAATIAAAAALREAGSEQVAAAMETDAMVAVDTARQEAAVAVRAVYCAPVRSAAPAVKGASEVWSGDVTDKAKLIEHIGKMVAAGNESLIGLLDVSQSGINAMAKLQKANLSLPGVRPVCTDRLAVRKQAVSA